MEDNTLPTLAHLREAAGLTQDQVAASFGLTGKKRRDAVAGWEHGAPPPASRRAQFIHYLWVTLALHRQPALFRQIWRDVMERQWGWLPPAIDELSHLPVAESIGRVPFQAIGEIPYFVGRQREIRQIEDCLLSTNGPRVCVLYGMAGAGKTALAAHMAATLQPFFPDGVLWARLDTSDTMSILRGFGQAHGLGVGPYHDIASLSRMVRETLFRRTCLVILDNVENDEQIEPLMPVSARNTAVLVTTRRPDLFSLLGFTRLQIGPFQNLAESLALFERVIGHEHIRRRLDEYARLAERLGHVPFALAIAAGLIENSIADGEVEASAVERLRLLGGLTYLQYGNMSIPAQLEAAIGSMPENLQALLSALGAVGGEDFDVVVAAYISEKSMGMTEEEMERLADFSFAQPGRPGRYCIHSLLQQYVRRELTVAAAYRRMAEYYQDILAQVGDLYKNGDQLTALDLFDREWTNIKAGQAWAAENLLHGAADLVCNYALVARLVLDLRLHPAEFQRWLALALEAADLLADRLRRARILAALGASSYGLGNMSEAIGWHKEALAILEDLDQPALEAGTRSTLGMAYLATDEYELSIGQLESAIQLARRTVNPKVEADALNNLGMVYKHLRQYDQAIAVYEVSLEMAREMGDLYGMANTLSNLGSAYLETGQAGRAIEIYRQSLSLQKQIGNRQNESDVLGNLGEAHAKLERFNEAIQFYEQSLIIDRELGNRYGECLSLNGMADVYLRTGDFDKAGSLATQALTIARSVPTREGEADALWFLARALAGTGEVERACKFAHQAEDLLREIGDPLAEIVRAGRMAWGCPN